MCIIDYRYVYYRLPVSSQLVDMLCSAPALRFGLGLIRVCGAEGAFVEEPSAEGPMLLKAAAVVIDFCTRDIILFNVLY